jgi:hypothetical protein
MPELYKFSIKERTMRSKLSINNYYTTNVLAKSHSSTRYYIIYTKSFNKNTYPNAKELAEKHIEELKKIYC